VTQLAVALDDDNSRFCADAQQLDWIADRPIHARTTLSRGSLVREYIPGLHLDPVVPSGDVVPTVCANGAAMLVRRDRHLELGGFDETFFLEWEDLDLCWRAWLRGWTTVYVPRAVVRHRVGAATSPEIGARRASSSHHNLVRFALKCLPPAAAARVVLGEVVRLPRHPRAISAGFAAVVTELPEIVRLRRDVKPSHSVFEELLSA
jgi:GT2 family glycosyltransferase